MLDIKKCQKMRKTNIRMVTGVVDAVSEAVTLKWIWSGHVAKSRGDNPARPTTELIPRDHVRTRGSQFKRWSDRLVQFCRSLWTGSK